MVLAHLVMEVEKSHNLPSTSWRPRKPVAQFKSESKGLRTRSTKGIHPSVRVGETDVPVRQRKSILFLYTFILFRPSKH